MGCIESVADSNVQLQAIISDYNSNTSNGYRLSVEPQVLTRSQAEVLLHSWSLLARRRDEIGRRVFAAIFDERPEMKHYFPFGSLDGDQLYSDVRFRSHAANFMLAIEGAMDNIDSLSSSYAPVLLNLGRRHKKVKASMQLAGDAFEVFYRAVLSTLKAELGPAFNNEVEEAWSALFNFFRVQLTRGYLLEGSSNGEIAHK